MDVTYRAEVRLPELIAGLHIGPGGDLAGGQPEEFVVGDLRCSSCRIPDSEGGRGYKIIKDSISAYQKVCGRVVIAFLAGSDDNRIMRGRALLYCIVLD